MIANALCMLRLRKLGFSSKTVYSHAMPSKYGKGSSCSITAFVPLTIADQGISMPISRGGPLIFNE